MTGPAAQAAPHSIDADHFDGESARARPVRLSLHGGRLRIEGETGRREIPLREIDWPDRQHRAGRLAHLPGGGTLQARDPAAFDVFVDAARVGEGWISRSQRSWRATLVAVALLALALIAGYRWGLPWASDRLAALMPPTLLAALDETVLRAAEGQWLQPSRLPSAQQQALRSALDEAMRSAYPADELPGYRLHFHASRLGPNAFALPGGSIVITDELVHKVDGRLPMLLGVLAHEAGHVRHRHGARLLVRTALLGAATSLAFGDFSGLLAGAPALLGQLAYSRDFEREADQESVRVLRAAGHSPAVMAEFFEILRPPGRQEPAGGPAAGIALSSHPADEERIRFFREAAAGPTPGR